MLAPDSATEIQAQDISHARVGSEYRDQSLRRLIPRYAAAREPRREDGR